MRENSTVFPAKKVQVYKQAQELPKKYKVLALVKMEKVRASQILDLRKKLLGEVEFLSVKNRVIKKAFKESNLKDMAERLGGQCLLLFTNMSPFKLNVLLSKNKIMMPARGGDIASIDVVVPPKNTGVAPGPMLTDFKEAKIPTKIDQGTIWITEETTPVKKGEPVPEKIAALLTKLDIKPIEAGITLNSALEDGIMYSAKDLTVDVQAVREEFAKAHASAIALSIKAGYVTAENIKQILAKASSHARALSTESGYPTKDTIKPILQKANAHASLVASAAKYESK
ncbi:MAG: ribosomal protein L10 [Cenarchaeum symbiont of Oopsacas minuta]|nr:ribosomal protein L10 [Cenarchaeum symbiont of Oopsacas minuta]